MQDNLHNLAGHLDSYRKSWANEQAECATELIYSYSYIHLSNKLGYRPMWTHCGSSRVFHNLFQCLKEK